MATTVLGPLLPLLAARWGLSDASAGSLFSAQFVGSLTATTASTLTTTRLGASRTLALGFVLMAAGIGTLGVAPVALAWPTTLVYGLGLGCVLPVTNNVVAALARGRESSALSLVNVSWGAGAMLWPIVVSTSAAQPAAATTTLAVSAAVVAFIWVVVPPLEGLVQRPGADSATAPVDTATVARFAILIFLYVGAETATAGWAAAFARRLSGIGDALWAYAPAAFWTAQTLGRLAVPLWLRGISERQLLVGSLVLGGVAISMTAAVASSVAEVVAFSAAAGFGLAAIFPLLWSGVSRRVAPARPALIGPLFAAGGLGGAVLPWAVGLVSHRTDLALGLSVPLAALAAMLAIALVRAPRLEAEKP